MSIGPLQVDVTGWLITQLTATGIATFGSERPPQVEVNLPFVQVQRIGGPSDGLVLDQPTVVFDVFAARMPAANRVAYAVAAAVHGLVGQPASGAVITRVRTLSGPRRVSVENQSLRHVALLMQPYIKSTL